MEIIRVAHTIPIAIWDAAKVSQEDYWTGSRSNLDLLDEMASSLNKNLPKGIEVVLCSKTL